MIFLEKIIYSVFSVNKKILHLFDMKINFKLLLTVRR